uniref:MARCKS-related protein n=1 Tax=Aotus nancymaae TaxID=37293 RepID=A0A2K5BYK8_AOTNA
MGSQSSKAPRGDVTTEEANAQENGHVKSNGDLSPKGEGESTPVNGTDEAAGATGDAIEPAPPSQGAEVKGEVPPEETPKRRRNSFRKPFKLNGLLQEKPAGAGEIGACCGEGEGTAQEGKAAATPGSQEPRAKGTEASVASEEATEPSTPSGPESGPTPASAERNG